MIAVDVPRCLCQLCTDMWGCSGMALGTGSAIAHRGIDAAWGAMFGGGSGQAPPEPAALQQGAAQLQEAHHPCANTAQLFADCMSKNNGDMGACDFVYNAMQECKRQNP
jgi:coiled-coil-helix-coiled-coil-helix domain-containing protein 10